jgi:FKBP-type peptidyl-prolyl cis-trans isomerase FkpA
MIKELKISLTHCSIVSIILISVFCSCKKADTKQQANTDEQIITSYIASNKLIAKATGSGLYYVISMQGTGSNPGLGSTVRVAYKGYLTSGSVFDQSSSAGISFGLNSVIKGWQEGIPLFKQGGRGKLLIPSALAYGSQSVGGIPANSVLIFDIELLDVQ